MHLSTSFYQDQRAFWPETGRHILAQFDNESVVVYQAYRPSIGHFAAIHGYFGGEFSLTRMSWIKTNFLWMMHRSSWGRKEGQEVTLAIRLKRSAFDEILSQAIHSTYKPEIYGSRESWQQSGARSDVRLQWDPDHAPAGAKQERRAIQLGLRGPVLAKYAQEWLLEIEDISSFVAQQYVHVQKHALDQLQIPEEKVYTITDPATTAHLQISSLTEKTSY